MILLACVYIASQSFQHISATSFQKALNKMATSVFYTVTVLHVTCFGDGRGSL